MCDNTYFFFFLVWDLLIFSYYTFICIIKFILDIDVNRINMAGMTALHQVPGVPKNSFLKKLPLYCGVDRLSLFKECILKEPLSWH